MLNPIEQWHVTASLKHNTPLLYRAHIFQHPPFDTMFQSETRRKSHFK